jgi:PAS domain S-box-containing protein
MDRSRKYAFVNNYFAKWFELPKSRLVGKTRAEVIGSRFHSANTSRQEDRAFRGEAASFELTLTRPSGETVNLDAEYIPDFDPRTGEVRGIIGLGHDVTERKRALRAIEASESRFRSLTDAIPQLIWTCSASGLVSYANKSCLNYSGFGSREELEGGWLATLHPQERERVTQSWRDCFAGGTAFNEEYRIRRKDGEFRWFLVRSIPIKNASGAIQYWIGTA